MCKIMTESMTKGLDIGTCISICDAPDMLPEFDTDVEHIYIPALPLRAGQYPDVDWSEIAPLDEELIESMAHCETVFLKMVERYAIYDDMSYIERKRQYLRHLRFWSHMLDEKKIDLMLLRGPPHQCYDLVIWHLCRHKGIRTLSMSVFYSMDLICVDENWEEVGTDIRVRMEELMEEYKHSDTPIELTPEFEEYFTMYALKRTTLSWTMSPDHPHLMHKNFLIKWIGPGLRVLIRKPGYFLLSVFSLKFWIRKCRHHNTRTVYDRLAKEPDLTVPYIYYPLHMQPEATTCPMAGAFVEQELIAQMLAACIPEGVQIYVKEHPNQGELLRDVEFYETLNATASVTLVPRSTNTFDLSENAVAIATATGNAGLEGLFKGRPVLLFGHRYYQYAPCVYRIRSTEDCHNAMESIFNNNERPTARDMRIFLKAAEETAGLCYRGPASARPPETREERSAKMGEYVRQKIVAMQL